VGKPRERIAKTQKVSRNRISINSKGPREEEENTDERDVVMDPMGGKLKKKGSKKVFWVCKEE